MKPRAALAALLIVVAPGHAQMYKCVDERGVTHYSDKPRPGCNGRELDIQPIAPLWGDAPARKDDLKREEREFQRRRIERARADEKAARAEDQQRKRCERLKAEQQRYSRARRIPVTDAKGERGDLDDAARETKLAQLAAEIGRQCR